MPEGRDFFGPSGVTQDLLERSRSKDPIERWAAILELGEIGDNKAALAIRRALSDLDELVYEAACDAARKLAPKVRSRAGIVLVQRPEGPPRVRILSEAPAPAHRAVPGAAPGSRWARMRPRRGRTLRQIPVQEIRLLLVALYGSNDGKICVSLKNAIKVIMEVYEVKKTEMDTLSALLTEEWQPLLEMLNH